jgi:hypothetical protein
MRNHLIAVVIRSVTLSVLTVWSLEVSVSVAQQNFEQQGYATAASARLPDAHWSAVLQFLEHIRSEQI